MNERDPAILAALERLVPALPQEPGDWEDVLRRLRALEAAPGATRGRFGLRRSSSGRRRRRTWPLIAVAALILGGGAIAATVFHWGPGSTGRVPNLVSEQAGQRFQQTPALAGAPWLTGGYPPTRIGEAAARPSLVFPPGTTYPEALQSFYAAVSRDGALPAGTKLGAPLPLGKVVRRPGGSFRGLAIDLRAPFGYLVPSGVVLGPQLADVAGATYPPLDRPGAPLPLGAGVHAPPLLPCQAMRGDVRGPTCRLSALPPGAAAAAGAVLVPDLMGARVAPALERIRRAHLGLFAQVGQLPAYTPSRVERVAAAGGLHGPRPGLARLDVLTREGYGSPRLEAPGRIGLALDHPAQPGLVVAQYPPAGTEVPPGTEVAVAVDADDCLGVDVSGPWDCVPGSVAGRSRTPAIAGRLPWLAAEPTGAFQRISRVGTRPSLVFPPRTTYAQALRALVVGVLVDGALPPGSHLGPPLPRGAVLALPGARGRGLALDLRAPFGWDLATGEVSFPTREPIGGIYPALLRRSVREGRAALLPAVFGEDYLAVPRLARCQIIRSGQPWAPCRLP